MKTQGLHHYHNTLLQSTVYQVLPVLQSTVHQVLPVLQSTIYQVQLV